MASQCGGAYRGSRSTSQFNRHLSITNMREPIQSRHPRGFFLFLSIVVCAFHVLAFTGFSYSERNLASLESLVLLTLPPGGGRGIITCGPRILNPRKEASATDISNMPGIDFPESTRALAGFPDWFGQAPEPPPYFPCLPLSHNLKQCSRCHFGSSLFPSVRIRP